MTEKPFVHKKAFTNVKLNFIFHEEVAKMLNKVLDKKGIINIGGPPRSVYNFAKIYNPKVIKTKSKSGNKENFPLNPYMNLSKLKNIIK